MPTGQPIPIPCLHIKHICALITVGTSIVPRTRIICRYYVLSFQVNICFFILVQGGRAAAPYTADSSILSQEKELLS